MQSWQHLFIFLLHFLCFLYHILKASSGATFLSFCFQRRQNRARMWCDHVRSQSSRRRQKPDTACNRSDGVSEVASDFIDLLHFLCFLYHILHASLGAPFLSFCFQRRQNRARMWRDHGRSQPSRRRQTGHCMQQEHGVSEVLSDFIDFFMLSILFT